jgi:hypothetical protein
MTFAVPAILMICAWLSTVQGFLDAHNVESKNVQLVGDPVGRLIGLAFYAPGPNLNDRPIGMRLSINIPDVALDRCRNWKQEEVMKARIVWVKAYLPPKR